jgi:predicted RNase H-like nuclease (RuvC/YqgF family)
MKTETITILSLMGTMVAYGVIHYFKHKQLKRYYKRMVSKNSELMDTIVEKDERIKTLSSKSENMVRDLLAENKRKSEKILAKNQEIQQLKEQAK